MHINIDLIRQHLDTVLESSEVNVYLKDRKGRYIDANHTVACLNKIELSDLKGKTDLDLLWKDHATTMMSNDAEVIHKGIHKTYLETAPVESNMLNYISHKAPLRTRNGKIIGIIGLSTLIDMSNFVLQQNHPVAEHLPQRQIDCLHYLVKGMTIKEIAKKVNLSPRTVEDHLNNAKKRLSCQSRSELISLALQMQIIRAKL